MKQQKTTIDEIELLSTEIDNLIKEVKKSMKQFISKETIQELTDLGINLKL